MEDLFPRRTGMICRKVSRSVYDVLASEALDGDRSSTPQLRGEGEPAW